MVHIRKYWALFTGICVLISMVACSSYRASQGAIVSEPYSIPLYFENKISNDILDYRIFEANTKRQFDKLVKKYKIHYDHENCLYEFDKEFFKNNKVYIIHTNHWCERFASKYKVEKNNDIIDLVIYVSAPTVTTCEIKKGAHGDLLAVSKEYAKNVKDVRVQYKH